MQFKDGRFDPMRPFYSRPVHHTLFFISLLNDKQIHGTSIGYHMKQKNNLFSSTPND